MKLNTLHLYFSSDTYISRHGAAHLRPAIDLRLTLTDIAFFTGMVNNTCIDWYLPWPEQALFAVASVFVAPDVSIVFFKLIYLLIMLLTR